MSITRPFKATDMFKFNNINLDVWTETYGIGFYLSYLSRWPDMCVVEESPSGQLMGYVIAKSEGSGTDWHGHITALTISPPYRRLSLASRLCSFLALISSSTYKNFYIDLYVRCANTIAIGFYEREGYSVYRRVREYYGSLGVGRGGRDEEDAFDMRMPLQRDRERRSVRPGGRDIVVSAEEVS
ncbi:N-acetyltransferase [Crepidotus variabilis]|uniref:N-acetyltransferase n=1 Tax=Crepidotus variabilis TaxID=179855 RepID=A0A9P6EB71_9AGAR|nr:N-acetyltransferase [Crepidotus variabilis]